MKHLAARYVHFNVDARARELTVDVSAVAPSGNVTLDVLVSQDPAGITGWKHVARFAAEGL